MTAATALEKQIERYRQMTGEERLTIALDLHELSCEIAREGIRRAHPAADPAEVEQLLHRRLELARARCDKIQVLGAARDAPVVARHRAGEVIDNAGPIQTAQAIHEEFALISEIERLLSGEIKPKKT
jgi:hypothetical protein